MRDDERSDSAGITMSITGPRLDRALKCRVDGCDGSPLSPTSGWHMVRSTVNGERFAGSITLFVCTDHLEAAEQLLVEHLERTETRPWEVETFRMNNWTDDGRGTAYIVATGGGDETLF